MAFNPAQYLDIRYALRKLLTNPEYHLRDSSIPRTEITPEQEPTLFEVIRRLATCIREDPALLLQETYTADVLQKDWKSLLEKNVLDGAEIARIDTRSRPGHKILDHHMPHFWDVENYKGVSVRMLMTQHSLEKALLQNVCMHSTPYRSEIRRMIVMTAGLGNVTKYRTTTSKAIVTYFNATRVFDPCIGWGGRMLGTLSTGASYTGCEPDPKTAAGLRNILSGLPSTTQQRAYLIESPAEEAFDVLRTHPLFDMVLTSPPYYNMEIYTGGPQSTTRFPTWEDWLSRWLKPLILFSLSRLKENGTSCWSVKNFRTDKTYPLADEVKKIHKDAGWTLVKTVVMTGSARPGANRIQDGKATRDSEEETFCFKRSPQE